MSGLNDMFDENSPFLRSLREILPLEALVTQSERLKPFECDGLSAYRSQPDLVCLPENIQQVQDVLKLCFESEVGVVARGAGTGLSGGALPVRGTLLLNMARFTKILHIDHGNRLARVQPGVRNIAISEAAAQYGLYYAPDPSSQIACTIGGNVAENAGGVHCLKYGLTVNNIVELKVLLMDGQEVVLGSPTLDEEGFDLMSLLTGSEGLLGIITEVTVKLLPKPEMSEVLLAAYRDVSAAARTVAEIIGCGIIPSGLELMDRLAIKAAEDYAKVGYPQDCEAILLCEIDGTNAEKTELIKLIEGLMLAAGAFEVRVSKNAQERLNFWAGRKAAFPAVGRLAPDYYCMDGTIPRKNISQVLLNISKLSAKYQLQVANVFHAGDGNLHPLILYNANQEGELEKAEAFGAEILEMCVALGGSITGEHGVGMEKLDQMCAQFGEVELKQFHAIKKSLDEKLLLNPGKAIPTLHRCAELGAMHVHGGKLPFPELDRF